MNATARKRLLSRLLIRAGLLLASFVLTFLVLEVLFRFLVPSTPPGTTYGKAVTRNALGLRDRDFAIPKPEDTYRIVVLGDSFTWGVGLDLDETLPKVLEKALGDVRFDGHVEVVNAAEPGHNTVEEFHLLRDHAIRYQPDLVLLIYNLNDIEYLPELSEQSYREESVPVVEIDPGEDLMQYSRHAGFRGFVLKIERRSVFVRFLVPRIGAILRRYGLIDDVEFSWVEKIYQGFTDENPGWLESKRALSATAQLCRSQRCGFMVAVYPLFSELEDYKGREVHDTIMSFCVEIGVEAIDLLPAFENTRTSSHWINLMDAHPNAAAHRAAAELLLPAIGERLSRSQEARSATGE